MRTFTILLFLTITPLFLSAQWNMVRFDEYNYFSKSATPDPATSVISGLDPSGNGSFILRTNDGGATWDSIVINTPSAAFHLMDLHFTDVNNGFAAGSRNNTNQYILKTTDNGNTWNDITPVPAMADPVTSIHFVNPMIGFASDETNFYRTTDGGMTWMNSVPGFGIEDIRFADINNGYACGQLMPDAVVMKTSDGGVTWNPVLSTMIPFFTASSMQTLDVVSADIVYVSGQYSNLLFRTLNGGLTWDTLTLSQIYSIQDYDFINANEGHVLSTMGEIFGTIDGGQTWTLEYAVAGGAYGPSVFLTSISFSGSTGYVCGSSGLIKKYTVPTGLAPEPAVQLFLYPNPARSGEIIHLKDFQKDFTLKVYTLTGQCIVNNEYERHSPVVLPLASGTYLLEIISGGNVLHEKLVVID